MNGDVSAEEEIELHDDGRDPESSKTQEDSSTTVSRKQRARLKRDPDDLEEGRIPTVLKSHEAIESYAYDTVNELWCEVSGVARCVCRS